jgi:hypothetical protein
VLAILLIESQASVDEMSHLGELGLVANLSKANESPKTSFLMLPMKAITSVCFVWYLCCGSLDSWPFTKFLMRSSGGSLGMCNLKPLFFGFFGLMTPENEVRFWEW